MSGKIEYACVVSNEPIGNKVMSLVLNYPESFPRAEAGQFINVYLNEKDKLLPRPISVCRLEGSQLTLVYGVVGKGTKDLSSYHSGTSLRISEPLGKGYDLSMPGKQTAYGRQASAMVVGGGLGVPPLVELTYVLVNRGYRVDAVIGFRDEPLLHKALSEAGAQVHIATENGTSGFSGNVLELIQQNNLNADCYFACGPVLMLKSLSQYISSKGRDVQVSLEERMGCGFGACVGCTCKIKETIEGQVIIQRKRVCKEGPVFWGSEVVWDA
ncbi:MAG: dihydroorotate dehydrogenase electron transfer subunit [Eubacteriales bacterium]|nr:dihydroorotate dehydrogenase electron transfer subunit [Eubacteriales bacterium]